MDIDAVAVYVKVVESGSFSGAARLLRMPKTTVSAKVAALEKRLGVTLIQRTTRRLHITDAGRTYFRHCALAIKELELGEASLLASRDHPTGLLKVTAPVDIGHALLPKICGAYLEKYPETSIELIITNRVVDLIAEGVDLAIRVGEMKDSTMLTQKFLDIDFDFVATPKYLAEHGTLKEPGDFAKHQLLAHPNMTSRYPQLTDGKTVQEFQVNARIKTDEIETNKALTLLHQGIGWLPNFLVSEELKAKELVKVLPKWKVKNPGHYSFVYPGQKFTSPNVKAFISLALAD